MKAKRKERTAKMHGNEPTNTTAERTNERINDWNNNDAIAWLKINYVKDKLRKSLTTNSLIIF